MAPEATRRPLAVAVCGAGGRMGRRVVELAGGDRRFALAVAFKDADVVIDFTSPSASLGFAKEAARSRKPIVIGTTGFSSRQFSALRGLARRCPLFLSPNLSLGANLLFHLAETAAGIAAGFDAAILETHHRMKKDAPSGTAKRLAQACGRPAAIVSQRIGGVVGDHTLTLAGQHERIELTHRAQSRDVFALGALEAALWLRGRRPGLYDMADKLGLR